MKRFRVVTGSRAEYGQLRPFLKLARESKVFELQIIAAGMHLSEQYGFTIRDIEADGYRLDGLVEMTGEPTYQLGMGIRRFWTELGRIKPDMVLVEGDRVEALAAALAAGYMGIPVAHGGGGDVTTTIDNAARHAISHFASLHFVSHEGAAARLTLMGIPERDIFVTGALGIDAIMGMDWWPRERVLSELGLPADSRYLLVAFHPETGHEVMGLAWMHNVMNACLATDLHVIITYPNSDPGSENIIRAIDWHVKNDGEWVRAFPSLGSERYLNALKNCEALVGNSSSGLYEAPSLQVPVVKVGHRQDGRPQAANVLGCGYGYGEIRGALQVALENTIFQQGLDYTTNPYGDGHAAERILKVIEERI